MKEEIYLKSTEMHIYENDSDKELGLPPLFKYRFEIFDINPNKQLEFDPKIDYRLKP